MAKATSRTVQQSKAVSTEVIFNSLIDIGDIPSDKLTIPRLSLLQSNSDAVQNSDFPVGQYHNTVTNSLYGETVQIIPLKIHFGAIYIINGEGMKCKSVDGITNMYGDPCAECPFGVNYKVWTEKERPKCSETIDILAMEAESGEPIIFTFKVNGYKEGKRLVTNLKLNKQACAVRLGAEKEKNEKGTFYVPKVKALVPLNKEQFEAAMYWKESLATKSYETVEE